MPYHTNQNNTPTPSSKGNYSSPHSRGSHNKTPVSDTTSTVSATTSSIEYKVEWKAENTAGSGFYLYGHRQMVIYELSGGVNT